VVTDRDTVEAEMESVLAERDRALEERDELRVRIVEMQQKEEATVSMSSFTVRAFLPATPSPVDYTTVVSSTLLGAIFLCTLSSSSLPFRLPPWCGCGCRDQLFGEQ